MEHPTNPSIEAQLAALQAQLQQLQTQLQAQGSIPAAPSQPPPPPQDPYVDVDPYETPVHDPYEGRQPKPTTGGCGMAIGLFFIVLSGLLALAELTGGAFAFGVIGAGILALRAYSSSVQPGERGRITFIGGVVFFGIALLLLLNDGFNGSVFVFGILGIGGILSWYFDRLDVPAEPEARSGSLADGGAEQAPRPLVSTHTELRISVLLGWIGVGLTLFGLAFLFRLAIEENLITPALRVVLGIVVALAGIAAGVKTHARYPSWSFAILGGSAVLAYFTLYTGMQPSYELYGQPVAFIGMLLTTATVGALAMRWNSQLVAGFTLIGGFLTPYLVSTSEPQFAFLIIYDLLLAGAAVTALLTRKWSWLLLPAVLTAGFGIFTAIDAGAFTRAIRTMLLSGWGIATVVLVLVESFRRPKELPSTSGWIALALTVFIVPSGLLDLLPPGSSDLMEAGVLLACGAVYALTALTLRMLQRGNPGLRAALALFGIALGAGAILLATHDITRLTTTLWALVALGLLAGARYGELHGAVRVAGYILLGAATVRFVAVDIYPMGDEAVIVSTRTLVTALLAGSYALLAQWEKEAADTRTVLYGFMHGLFLLLLARWSYEAAHPYQSPDWRQAFLSLVTVLYAFYGAGALAFGFLVRRKSLRTLGLVLLIAVILKVLVIDFPMLERVYRVIAYTLVGIICIAASFAYQRFRDRLEPPKH